ncbi:MAG: hypothetical protein J7K88_02470 [Candidatus Fermentibacteraceae bacterium]|nr:hypothetical protein [Candidatus Fermentibacteraceae bacterium]
MSMLFLVFCLFSQSVDTLWTVDFSTTSGDWVAGPQWQWLDDSVYLDIELNEASCRSGYSSLEDSLVSPNFVVPVTADSLVLVFDHFWWGHGNKHDAAEWSRSTSSLGLHSSANPTSIVLWEVSGYCGSPWNSDYSQSYSVYDSGYVFVPLLDVSAGDSLSFVFRGLVETYWYNMNAIAIIEWNLYSFSILNYPYVSLERSTWGAIKATF